MIEVADNSLALNSQLSSLVDGGSTDALNMGVQTSFPNEAWQLYSELLDKSPYFSDTVMKSSIDKEEVLPNAMIRDILVANPQSAKSQSIMGMLDDRIIPMPEYMKDDVAEGANILGNKENLEMEISMANEKYAESFSSLRKVFLYDTTNIWAVDSLIAALEWESSLSSRYAVAAVYTDHGLTAQAFNVVSSIPTQYTLTPEEEAIHENMEDYYALMLGLQNQNKTIFDADSSFYAALECLAQDPRFLPGVYSRNTLIAAEKVSYQEPINLPEEQFAGSVRPGSGKISKTPAQRSSLSVFPNPAKTHVIVNYTVHGRSNVLTLKIFNSIGSEIQSILLSRNKDQIVIPVSNYSSGNYHICVASGSQVINSSIITIIR